MANHQNLSELLVETVGELPQGAEEFEDGDLQKRILDASDLILSVMLLRDQSIGPCDLGHELNKLRGERVINVDRVFHERHAAEQHSMTLLLETGGDLGHKLRNVLGHPLHNFDRSKDGLLPNVSRVVVDTLHREFCYLEHILMQIPCQLRGADLRQHAQGQTDDVVVVAVEVDSDPVGGHHQQFRLFVEELGEA